MNNYTTKRRFILFLSLFLFSFFVKIHYSTGQESRIRIFERTPDNDGSLSQLIIDLRETGDYSFEASKSHFDIRQGNSIDIITTKENRHVGRLEFDQKYRGKDTLIRLMIHPGENGSKNPSDRVLLLDISQEIRNMILNASLFSSSEDDMILELILAGAPAIYAGFEDDSKLAITYVSDESIMSVLKTNDPFKAMNGTITGYSSLEDLKSANMNFRGYISNRGRQIKSDLLIPLWENEKKGCRYYWENQKDAFERYKALGILYYPYYINQELGYMIVNFIPNLCNTVALSGKNIFIAGKELIENVERAYRAKNKLELNLAKEEAGRAALNGAINALLLCITVDFSLRGAQTLQPHVSNGINALKNTIPKNFPPSPSIAMVTDNGIIMSFPASLEATEAIAVPASPPPLLNSGPYFLSADALSRISSSLRSRFEGKSRYRKIDGLKVAKGFKNEAEEIARQADSIIKTGGAEIDDIHGSCIVRTKLIEDSIRKKGLNWNVETVRFRCARTQSETFWPLITDPETKNQFVLSRSLHSLEYFKKNKVPNILGDWFSEERMTVEGMWKHFQKESSNKTGYKKWLDYYENLTVSGSKNILASLETINRQTIDDIMPYYRRYGDSGNCTARAKLNYDRVMRVCPECEPEYVYYRGYTKTDIFIELSVKDPLSGKRFAMTFDGLLPEEEFLKNAWNYIYEAREASLEAFAKTWRVERLAPKDFDLMLKYSKGTWGEKGWMEAYQCLSEIPVVE